MPGRIESPWAIGLWTIALALGTAACGNGAGASGAGGSTGTGGAPSGDGGASGSAGDGGGVPADAAADASPPAADPGFSMMWSGTVLGVPGNELLLAAGPFVHTYRTYVKPRDAGQWRWAFWMSNAMDSTFGPGPPVPNMLGGAWRVEAAYFADGGTDHKGAVVAGTQIPVTFSGNPSKDVQPGERFWSDPVSVTLPAGHYLAFTWAISGAAAGPSITYTSAPFLTSYRAANVNVAAQETATGFVASTDPLVAPQVLAYDRPIANRLCFLGDSITQGIGSTRDSYGYWVAKIADGLGPDTGVWNLGSGWARAADAASDGYWLYKAKQCSEVAVILGVNDIINSSRTAAQILADLATILASLKQNNPAAKTILFTVPTFNLGGQAYTTWKQVNDTIRTQPPAGADRVFDIAAVQSQPAPNDGLVKPQYTNGDPHPNDVAGTDIANAFLAWYQP